MPRKGYKQTEEHKRKLSEMKKGKRNPAWKHGGCEGVRIKSVKGAKRGRPKGYKLSEETKQKISETRKKNSGYFFSKDIRKKMSIAQKRIGNKPPITHGAEHPNWKGGTSFEPYCPNFNGDLKEKVRNNNDRKCALCDKSEILNGRRLSVHHIDGDKMQGCDGKKWKLISLCQSCHTKCHFHPIEYDFLIIINC